MPVDRDKLAQMLGINKHEQALLDAGSAHPYNCRCDNCLRWWKLMGPDENGAYGPFTEAEVKGVQS